MPAVQVRDFSNDIYNMIKTEAKASGRSITQQTKHIVVEHFTAKPSALTTTPETAAAIGSVSKNPPAAYSAYAFESSETNDQIQARIERRHNLLAKAEQLNLPPWPQGLDPVSVIREARDER